MKAIGFKTSLPIEEANSFIEFETEQPQPQGHQLLVKIDAISVNPVDFKVRQSSAKDTDLTQPKVIGWDAVGEVVAIGDSVSLFAVGDKVYYAGDLTKPGCNAEYQVVDERIVGKKPKSLSNAEAAALPLTSLTAWEMLFDRMRIDKSRDAGKTLLILAGAGGVGSIAIQLAKKVAGLRVVATASRPETIAWCREMGADIVVDHKNLKADLAAQGINEVDFIIDLVDINAYWDVVVELIKPQGHIASITGSGEPIALNKLKNKSATFSWELMYTRSMYQTDDMSQQHHILCQLADLVDAGVIKTTLKQTFTGFSADNLKKVHEILESGKAIGKVVIAY